MEKIPFDKPIVLSSGIRLHRVWSGEFQPQEIAMVFGESNTQQELRDAIPEALKFRDEITKYYWNSVQALRNELDQAQQNGWSYKDLAIRLGNLAAQEIVLHVEAERYVNKTIEERPELCDLPLDQWGGAVYLSYLAVQSGCYLDAALRYVMSAIGHKKKSLEKASEYINEGLKNARSMPDDNLNPQAIWPDGSYFKIDREQMKDAIKNWRKISS